MSTRLLVGRMSQIACHHRQDIWDSALNTLECCPFPSSSFGHSKHKGDHAFGTVWSIFMQHQNTGTIFAIISTVGIEFGWIS
jgi:hypothetical protein